MTAMGTLSAVSMERFAQTDRAETLSHALKPRLVSFNAPTPFSKWGTWPFSTHLIILQPLTHSVPNPTFRCLPLHSAAECVRTEKAA
jgi:hypothetical protein